MVPLGRSVLDLLVQPRQLLLQPRHGPCEAKGPARSIELCSKAAEHGGCGLLQLLLPAKGRHEHSAKQGLPHQPRHGHCLQQGGASVSCQLHCRRLQAQHRPAVAAKVGCQGDEGIHQRLEHGARLSGRGRERVKQSSLLLNRPQSVQ